MCCNISPEVYRALKELVNADEDNFKIIVHNSNKKGEGFLSEIQFVTLQNKKSEKEINVVVKQAFTSQSIRNSLPIREFYANEIHFYSTIWPVLNKFQQRIPVACQFQKLPKYLGCVLNENLILENLKNQNFQIHYKRKSLDQRHFELILKEYGKFHGLSFAYKALHPQEFSEMVKPLVDIYSSIAEEEFYRNGTKYLFELCYNSLQPGIDDAVMEKFKPYLENYKELLVEYAKIDPKNAVITHGDCWSNNMMFKYNNVGEVIDVRFLDFQLARLASPCSDLSYCIYSGASKEILENLDHYIQVYRQSLSETLTQFGYDSEELYPLQDMMEDWKRSCKLGFTFALMIWKLKFTYDEDLKDHKDLEHEERDQIFHSSYDENAFKEVVRDLLLHLHENDFL